MKKQRIGEGRKRHIKGPDSFTPMNDSTPQRAWESEVDMKKTDSWFQYERLPMLLAACLTFAGPGSALHIIPDHPRDPHFTSGPCPVIVPKDGAACPNGARTCPAFYNPALLPTAYNSVSYCASVPAGIGFGAPGVGFMTAALDPKEQEAFLRAARKVESYVKDNVTVVVEPYKTTFLDNTGTNVTLSFYFANEYWTAVCAADALLPPFTTQQPTIVQNPDGSYSYQGLPETYTLVLNALKRKNASNQSPMELINFLPSQQNISVEWPPTFFSWQAKTNLASNRVSNYLVGTSNNYPITPNAKPFTLCGSPAAMKMLGLAPFFNRNGHTIDDINSAQYNMNVTLEGTDGAIVIPDLATIPPPAVPQVAWMYDHTDPSVVGTQLPKAYYEHSANYALPYLSCSDPTQCTFPEGVDGGADLTGLFNHEINHILGLMQSQYYKVANINTALPYAYGTALFLLDLFDVDSDYVVSGYGHPGLQKYSDFTAVPRNNDPYEPTTIVEATSPAQLTPWVQFGLHDHVMVYDVTDGTAKYFPLQDYSPFNHNPDGDIQSQIGVLINQSATKVFLAFVDPNLIDLPSMNVVHLDVQGVFTFGPITMDSIREYSELAAVGWNIDYTTLSDQFDTVSPLETWYRTCFDATGVFTPSQNPHCKFSVEPQDFIAR